MGTGFLTCYLSLYNWGLFLLQHFGEREGDVDRNSQVGQGEKGQGGKWRTQYIMASGIVLMFVCNIYTTKNVGVVKLD